MKLAIVRALAAVELLAGVTVAAGLTQQVATHSAAPAHSQPVSRVADAPTAVVRATVSTMPAAASVHPSVATPAPATQLATAHRPAAPACSPNQLRAQQRDVKVALGSAVATYVVQETGGKACSLSASQPAWVAPMVGPASVKSLSVQSTNGASAQPTLAPNSMAVVQLALQNVVSSLVPQPAVSSLTKSVSGLVTPSKPASSTPLDLPPIDQLLKNVGTAVQSILTPPAPASLPPPPAPPPPPPPSNQTTYPVGSGGFDISWPQCGGAYPGVHTVSVVGVNDGRAFTTNPCLQSEANWAGSGMELYINLNSPRVVNATDQSGPAGNCGAGDNGCLAYNYGFNTAAQSVSNAAAQGVGAKTWWIDIETVGQCTGQFPTNSTGYWSCDQGLNSRTIQGAIDGLLQAGLVAGLYSTHYQWGVITGGYVPAGPAIPNWLAGAEPTADWCSGSHNFAGGTAWLLQLYPPDPFDRDQAC